MRELSRIKKEIQYTNIQQSRVCTGWKITYMNDETGCSDHMFMRRDKFSYTNEPFSADAEENIGWNFLISLQQIVSPVHIQKRSVYIFLT